VTGRRPPRSKRRGRASVFTQWLDSAFPTLVRYGGVVLMAYAALVDRGSNPALIPAATGMLFFKSVYGSGSKD
jgi:hypothetical protein